MRPFAICLLGCCLIIALAACSGAPEIEATAATVLRLTAEQPPTATFVATAAAYPTVTPQVFCDGAPESFLIIGERGRVTLNEDGRWLNLRAGPGTDKDVIAQLAPLEEFLVLDGVSCVGPYAWYQIEFRGRVGWIAEGYDGLYYAEPWLTG
ncbi:MAG: SH3 domain-containing protein [Chloroflexi bacterium]|nr:SH3 domain-containing protein [Chloroflexota bacterium]